MTEKKKYEAPVFTTAPWSVVDVRSNILKDRSVVHKMSIRVAKADINSIIVAPLMVEAAPEMYALLADLLGEIERDELPIKDRASAYTRIVQVLSKAIGGVQEDVQEDEPDEEHEESLAEKWLEEYKRLRREREAREQGKEGGK